MPAAGTKPYGTRYNVPAGVILPYVGQEAPPGWLLCYGQSVLKSDYPELYAKCLTRFGAGTSTQFVLPDLRGRVVAGRDNMGGVSADRLANTIDGDILGAAGGNEEGDFGSRSDVATTGAATVITPGGVGGRVVQPTIVLDYIVKT